MKLPLSLIKSFITLDMSPAKIGDTLTLLGLEVDYIHNEKPPFSGVVVGEVLSTSPHPDAKNLQIAQVTDGKEKFTLVCGASNCRAGLKTAFAKVGALITDEKKNVRRIEKTSIRNVQSEGMLCSKAELLLSKDHDGIIELPHDFPVGESLINLLWDPVFEISLTPNLGHAMSALGVARELSASLNTPLHPAPNFSSYPELDLNVTIEDKELTPRYACCLIENVKIGPSPFWLQMALESVGQKSINNIVDVTNYISMKFGQPLHAFDFDLIEGDLKVGPSKKNMPFKCLDGIDREIPEKTILISDEKKALAVGGIIGGANSAVNEKTKTILLEAAFFDPITIRKSARKIVRTESAQKFEKGIDPNGLIRAINEAIKLIDGKVKGLLDLKGKKFSPKEISFRTERINNILGTKLSQTEIEEIFQRLGFKVIGNKVEVPTFRSDIQEEIDLVEEVARIFGYNNIEKTSPSCTLSNIPNDPIYLFENEMRKKLSALGLFEFLSCDLLSPELAEIGRKITPASMKMLESSYSKSAEYSILRTSLLPALLQVTEKNISQKNEDIRSFEIGRIHYSQENKIIETPMAAILLSGKKDPSHWSHKTVEFDFFDLKGMIESLGDVSFAPSNHIAFHPGRQADICNGDLIIGSLGEVHPSLLEPFGIKQRVYYAELNLEHLMKLKPTHHKISQLSQFPASDRDWTIPIDASLPIEEVFNAIFDAKSPLLEKVELIDLYQKEQSTKKNATFRFVYRDRSKTISFEEVEKEHVQIISNVEANILAK